ncbi:sporulation membrane protein YtaF [Schinkia azotoformans]|uniref:Putative sporulation protein YtaF n=1 Tax=Schinkia azotoformans LMG 9581 TaxID=1131731 RepID=K6DKD7_SCHAZ|nr:sporulation membrane protein YtaF [Schinkia azotoformans]EKN68598.1 putative sporulation protein YtaF [Schinkia azotoformans LMG 9581]MEC1637623.1 sporulation membrane protein YtaF [Schinkia azotoformans]MEC1718801.1 sporulation membrane protein YtaF [Schinkia azotoformans]MEC1944028.1 sporulation membrane protein YtaF [Schinkia azotoformans]MED4412987.1 sporulation membrane protein YtaF [Schinkia azotoformans]
MSDLFALLLLALAVSLDSFTVGLTYGLRKVSIPLKSILVISSCTFFVLLLAMGIGSVIEMYISYHAAERIGGIILIGIGIWVLIQFFTSNSDEANPGKPKMVEFEIKSLGLIVKILKKPMEADLDKSGTISVVEAFILGIALSLDSFGAGIGAALIDLPPILFALIVTFSSAFFVIAGINIGRIFGDLRWFNKFSLLSGVALILIGIFRM